MWSSHLHKDVMYEGINKVKDKMHIGRNNINEMT